MGRKGLWGGAALLWVLFTFWYTNTGGALTPEEVEHYVARYAEANGGGSSERLRAFLAADTGNQFLMVNLLDFDEDPPTVAGAQVGESAQSLLGRYMEFMWPALLSRACHPVWMGRAVGPNMDVVGIENADGWNQAALMRYRSRRDMIEIASNPEFAGRHEFKLAALEKTIAFPVENALYLSDPRLLLALLLLILCGLADRFLTPRRSQ